MNGNMILKRSSGVVGLALLGLASAASANTVDLFADPVDGSHTVSITSPQINPVFTGPLVNTYPVNITASKENPEGLNPGYASILGGYRDLVVTLNTQSGPGAATVTASAGGGGYSFATTPGDSGTGRIQWDGKDATDALGNGAGELNKTGLNNANLVFQEGCGLIGCSYFSAVVISADLGFQYQIGVYTDASNYSILTATVPFEVSAPVLANYQFDWFKQATGNYVADIGAYSILKVGSGPDFEKIGALEFVVNSNGGTLAVDLALGAITKQSVPEPGSLALIGLALFGAAAARRRAISK